VKYVCFSVICITASNICTHTLYQNSKQIFPEMELRGLVPYFYIHVSVSDLNITTIGPPILQ
jgi:hypothetical protein